MAAVVEPSANGANSSLELDVAKLHSLPSEQQDLYLLTYTSNLVRHVSKLDADGASAHQMPIKKELFKVINLSSPAPTRVIRNNLGRCLAAIFGKGDRKLLVESINELVGIINTGKGGQDVKARHAAAHCLGAIFEAAGDSAIMLSSLAITALLRLLKVAQTHTGFRGEIFRALGRIYKGIGDSADEPIARDVWKQARQHAVSDKSLLVQSNACWCMEQMALHTPYFDNSNDYEKLQSVVWKAIDSASPSLRHAAASCLATVLVKSHSDLPTTDAVVRVKKLKKPSKKQSTVADGEEEAIERSESPAPTRPATQLSFDLIAILRQLSQHYVRAATSNRARAGIAVCYTKVLRGLGESVVETHYGIIARHLLEELLSSLTIVYHRYRQLTTRRYVRIILEDVIGRKMLGETGQLNAARFLLNEIIKDYPQAIKERPEPSKQALTGALSALGTLMISLGSATNTIAETCREGLLQVLQHPSYTVQVHAASALRAFVVACPQQLLPSVTVCMNSVNRELGLLANKGQSPRRCVGYANGLAAVISTSNQHPLHGSVDISSRVLSQATTLLKSSSSSDLRISSTQIQVAWILIGGLMSLGPNFVKIHLSQLLLLWKNALPKPLNKDHITHRNLLELSFLSHVRECALGSILTFLEFNSRLLTLDVSKRLAGMLQNTSMFLSSLPSKKTTEDITQRLSPALQLQDFDTMVRRRVMQCYVKLVDLSPAGGSEVLLQTNLLPLALAAFADPDSHAPSSLTTSIASAAGAFESIWDVGDNVGYGVTGLVRGLDLRSLAGENGGSFQRHWMSRKGAEAAIDQTLLSPVCHAREHDSVALYLNASADLREIPDPPSTETVNAAIRLFATCMPLQASKVQESILEQMTTFLSSSSLQRDPARKTAMTVNIAMAVLETLKVANRETASSSGDVKSSAVEKGLQELLRSFLVNPDPFVRHIAAQALGRLCSIYGNTLTVNEVNSLMDLIVANREPNVRAGCALALGCIHSQLGGMAAGFHLKNIISILMSLATDPHPTVHFWALEAIFQVADSAGLTFSGYVTSTLGIVAQLYVVDTHNEESASLAASNQELDVPSPAVVARCTDSLINVLGPDLQDMVKARDMIMILVGQYQLEDIPLVLIESLRCLEHLSLYAPGHLESPAYIRRLQLDLKSDIAEVHEMAVDGLHNLMRRDAEHVFNLAKPGLDDQLWLLLDEKPDNEVVTNIIRHWLQQTALTHTANWIQRCHTVLSKIVTKSTATPSNAQPKPVAEEMQDEEVAGFAAAAGTKTDDQPAGPASSQELLKWHVRTFAMDILSELIQSVAKHAALIDDSEAEKALQLRIADVVRIAFSASTAGVVALRIRGLRIIDQVLKMFGKTPDPDFPEAPLLEQYQAQISSALTPAFAADSSPELAAQAIYVCASFISTGIVTDVDRMGRIPKLLVSSMDNFSSDNETATIGDLKGLSSNAQVMVRMAVLSAWAELQIASSEQKYLEKVVKPHIGKLTPLWLSSLREFARLRFEPDVSTSLGPASVSGSLDTIYAALNRETLLKFYQDSWLSLVDAIASLIEENSEFVFDALDGKIDGEVPNDSSSRVADISYRDEPAAFFFVLFGLTFEALVGTSGNDSQTAADQVLELLQALKKILRPSVAGRAIYAEAVFSEAMDLLDRLALTEGLAVQSVIVEIARNLCLSHPSARNADSSQRDEQELSEDIDQLFELTRIIVLVLAGLIPNLSENISRARHELNDEAVTLVRFALEALVGAADVFPSIIQTDLHACIIHIFANILATGSCQATVVPQALPILRRFLTSISHKASPSSETAGQIRSAFARFLIILNHAQKRETEAALPCEKNTLLALTLLLTSSSSMLQPDDALISRFVETLADCLGNRLTSKVAANCCRTLLVTPNKTPADAALVALLLPHLLSFLANPSDVEGLDESRSLVAHALTSMVPTLPGEKVPTALAILIPVLLARASKEGSATYKETASRILELAQLNQSAFRSTIAGMNSEQRAFVEEVLREGGIGTASNKGPAVEVDNREPSIALRMNF